MINTSEIRDSVARKPLSGINVLIIGAGVGGLHAALECWRQGHNVTVFERASKCSPLGDFFTIGPSALATLHHYPSMFADYHSHVEDCTVSAWLPDGTCLMKTVPEWVTEGEIQHAAPCVRLSFLNTRPQWVEMLLAQLKRLDIEVRFDAKVVKVQENPENATIFLEDGQSFHGDVCIAAGGISADIEGLGSTGLHDVGVQDFGYAVARVAFPTKTIKPGSPAATLLSNVHQQPEFRVYLSKDKHLILFFTPKTCAWVLTHSASSNSTESWSNLIDASEIIEELKQIEGVTAWDPAVMDFLAQSPDLVVDWRLKIRDCVSKWTSDGGRLLRLGDLAHPFLPTAGNGAITSIEDALSIAECLRSGGKQNVPLATRVHNVLRFQRVSILQRTGLSNRDEIHTTNAATVKEDLAAKLGFFKMGQWVFRHNPERYARENWAACVELVKQGRGHEFKNTNLPPDHVYEPWSLESEMDRIRKGIPSDLKKNGDWS